MAPLEARAAEPGLAQMDFFFPKKEKIFLICGPARLLARPNGGRLGGCWRPGGRRAEGQENPYEKIITPAPAPAPAPAARARFWGPPGKKKFFFLPPRMAGAIHLGPRGGWIFRPPTFLKWLFWAALFLLAFGLGSFLVGHYCCSNVVSLYA